MLVRKQLVSTDRVPKSKAPLSNALEVNGSRWVFCSGQLGVNPDTGELFEDLEAQTAQVMENLKALVESAGGTMSDVVKCTVFLTDMADFQTVNDVYRRYFEAPLPTRSAMQVAGLARGARVEIECIAILG